MVTIAHIINPFHAKQHADLAVAQPITFESMRNAKQVAQQNGIQVELLSAQFEEDLNAVPEGFRATNNLVKSTQDFGFKAKLPLIADIIDRAYAESTADYLVYTNVDIGMYPEFYVKIAEFIANGHDAFIINRRRLPEIFDHPNQLDSIYKVKGKSHPGFDCFVIHRSLIPKFSLAEIVIGVPFIGIGMAQNVFCFAQNPKVFENEILTFHIGLEIFRKRASKDYFIYNRNQFRIAMKRLLPLMDSRKWPYGNKNVLERMIRWGLNPSLPIKLALKLEPRRWF